MNLQQQVVKQGLLIPLYCRGYYIYFIYYIHYIYRVKPFKFLLFPSLVKQHFIYKINLSIYINIMCLCAQLHTAYLCLNMCTEINL